MFANLNCKCGHTVTVIHHNRSCALEAHDFTPEVIREIEAHNNLKGCDMPTNFEGYFATPLKGYKNK